MIFSSSETQGTLISLQTTSWDLKMELQINNVEIRNVEFDIKTEVEGGVPSINKSELKNLLMDNNFLRMSKLKLSTQRRVLR